MQTKSIPLQLNTASNAASPAAPAQPGMHADGVNFGAALTRQIEQRQLESRQAVAQPQRQANRLAPDAGASRAQGAPRPAPPASPAHQGEAASASNAQRATRRDQDHDPVRAGAQGEGVADASAARVADAAAGTGTASARGEATGEANGEAGSQAKNEAATSADARRADALVDMLALVASFNQQQPAAAGVTLLPSGANGAGAGADERGAAAAGSPDPASLFGADAGTAAVTAGEARAGADPRALLAGKPGDSAVQAQPAALRDPALAAEPADFSAALRASAAQAASKQEAMPDTAALNNLAAAPALQQAQAAAGAAGERLNERVGSRAWDNEVGQKVIWMVGGAEQSATLELNPPDLGPVQVVLNVSNDMASVTFTSKEPEVRAALENALPRLREMMNESGIALGNASVNAGADGRAGQEGQAGRGTGRGGAGNGAGGGGTDERVDVAPRQRASRIGGPGAVDTFA